MLAATQEVFTEETVTTDPKMGAIVERLRKERDNMEQEKQRIALEEQEKIEGEKAEYYALGFMLGSEWSMRASYADLLYASKHQYYDTNPFTKHLGGLGFTEKEEPWKEFLKDIFQQDLNLQISQNPHGPGPNTINPRNHQTAAWIKGWFKGISELWDQVQSDL